ncbi:energy-coupling factor ABC transporter ATP-binding protein [Clostridium sardiniense]|uniref:Energy-coupling factor ABC transporter ATP-binding protein n=1 Tax=Clostridium sardiniense TaxID=29369 RepID=A0ABS7KZY3_CLOSR|nr:ABC transporter ATP-binding protein [Clostridium sardiniense]MBY0756368.1 energy-coupling factor ABC transporter ATP-binding protein [Clostridium sardiniense]MDQ0459214.1 cobalt/nickel transport system ATP-binding protein [Clostridium sardiniense]
MIKLENVYFSYKDKIALRDINIEIKEGESVALIGPNGCGKSTLLKILNGILNLEEGKYIFDDDDITEKKLNDTTFSKSFHKRIGFIFQNSNAQLFCSTVYDEVAFGPRQMGLREEQVQSRVNDCLELLNIKDLKDREPYNLSGGEKKRVAIASVLSLNPEILVLDEPLNEIDPKGKKFIRELLIKLNESGKTIICSTHEFGYIKGVFKRGIVFSEDNHIIKDDDFEKILEDIDFLEKNNIL